MSLLNIIVVIRCVVIGFYGVGTTRLMMFLVLLFGVILSAISAMGQS